MIPRATSIRSEGGYVVPTVLLMMVAALAIATAVAFASISAQHGTVRDQDSKLGIAVAESGVGEAMTRYNSVPTSNSQPCLGVSGGGSITGSGVPASGWCDPVGPGTSNDGTYTYQVRPTAASGLTGQIEIVATGTVNGVNRRVKVTANSASGTAVFTGGQTVLTQNGITMNSNASLQSGASTNGSITLASNAKICGAANVGLGQQLTLSGNSQYYSDNGCTQSSSSYGQQALTLPSFNQGDAATNNDNVRLTNAKAGTGSPADLISGSTNNVAWSSSTRQLSASSNTQLTLTGSKYSLCKLTLSSNVTLAVAAGQSTSIFFDSPEACNLPNNTAQLDMQSNSRITTTSGSPTNVVMYFVGSSSLATRALFASNTQVPSACVSNFVIYAPRTDVTMNSNAAYCGALASKTLQMDSNAKIYSDSGASSFTLAATGSHFTVSKFVECTAVPPAGSTSPDAGC